VSLDRARPPTPGPPRPYSFPDFEVHELTGGARLYLARRTTVPLVDVQILFPAGGRNDPPDAPGLASFTAGLLDEGTQHRTALELATAVEDLGGYVASGAGWDHAFAAVGMLGRHLELGAGVLCEVSTEPSFPPEEVQRARRRRLAELKQRRDDPSSLASDHFAAALYGDGPYSYPLVGRAESVEHLSDEDLRLFYRRFYAVAGTVVVAVGDLDSSVLHPILDEALHALPASSPPPPPPLLPTAAEGIEIRIVDRPKAAQTELRIGHPGPPQPHPDRITLQVLNSILGGKFTSRINLNLREVHGFTYGAHSQFLERLGPGPFVIATSVGNEVAGAAVAEVLAELRRVRAEPVTEDELDDAKSYLLGIFPYPLQTLHGLSRRLQEIAVFDLPLDYFNTYPERLAAVSHADVQTAARRHLREDDGLVIVAVGPGAELAEQLGSLGTLRLVAP
jgi:zinc protease